MKKVAQYVRAVVPLPLADPDHFIPGTGQGMQNLDYGISEVCQRFAAAPPAAGRTVTPKGAN